MPEISSSISFIYIDILPHDLFDIYVFKITLFNIRFIILKILGQYNKKKPNNLEDRFKEYVFP